MSLGSEMTSISWNQRVNASSNIAIRPAGKRLSVVSHVSHSLYIHKGQPALPSFHAYKLKILYTVWAQKDVLAWQNGLSLWISKSAHGLVTSKW
jgi:hypothetical protein